MTFCSISCSFFKFGKHGHEKPELHDFLRSTCSLVGSGLVDYFEVDLHTVQGLRLQYHVTSVVHHGAELSTTMLRFWY
jgi:hypothetical protein